MFCVPISKFRQNLLQTAQASKSVGGAIIMRNSEPLGVYLPFAEWEKINAILEEKQEEKEDFKKDMSKFWKKTKQKLKDQAKSSVLTQEEIDKLSYVS